MAEAIIKLKVMLESPDVDLESVKEKAKQEIEKLGGMINSYEEEPIAFGLKALIAVFLWPEEKDTSLAEDVFKNIPGISSVDIVDYRRAFG